MFSIVRPQAQSYAAFSFQQTVYTVHAACFFSDIQCSFKYFHHKVFTLIEEAFLKQICKRQRPDVKQSAW